jgi:histidine triad (HIT) family protein
MVSGDARSDDCFVCRKHRGEIPVPGGWIYHDDLVRVSHLSIPDGEIGVYLGWVVVEPNRHAPGLGDLTKAEAQRVGLVVSRVSRALQESEGAEHVYAFVLGHHVPHLHVYVVPRYPGTPPEYWGMRIGEWAGAPQGDGQVIATVTERLRLRLQSKHH